MTNAESPNIDTVSDAEQPPRKSGQPMTLKLLCEPVHRRYGYENLSDMQNSRGRMSAEWRLVEEQELTNRLLECLVMMHSGILELSMKASGSWGKPNG